MTLKHYHLFSMQIWFVGGTKCCNILFLYSTSILDLFQLPFNGSHLLRHCNMSTCTEVYTSCGTAQVAAKLMLAFLVGPSSAWCVFVISEITIPHPAISWFTACYIGMQFSFSIPSLLSATYACVTWQCMADNLWLELDCRSSPVHIAHHAQIQEGDWSPAG